MFIANYQTRNLTKFAFANFLTMLLIILSGVIIYNSAVRPIYDQQSLLEFSFTRGYPKPEEGITSNLIVGIVNLIRPYQPITTNILVRTLASSLYIISSSLLVWALTKRYRLNFVWFILFALLIFTSRFPFLWLSSELFAGAFLMLTMWSVITESPFVITAFFVALFSWAKPDLLIPGFVLGMILAIYKQKEAQNNNSYVFLIVLMLTIFFVPGIILMGSNYLQLSNRSFFSFCQHYASTVSPHQMIQPPLDPWEGCQTYIASSFGNEQTFLKIVKENPANYMDFVFLSLSKSLQKMIAGNLIFLLPFAITGIRKTEPNKLKIATIFTFVINFGLIITLSYFHVRYQARYYPLALMMMFIGLSGQHTKSGKLFLWAYLLILLVIQIFQSIPIVITGCFFID